MKYNEKKEIINDMVCQVYAGEKSKNTIDLVLNKYLPQYEPLNLDYAYKIEDENDVFNSENEMIQYFIDTKNIYQSFYWHQWDDNPFKIMLGAIIVNDDKLIISLTMDGTLEEGFQYFNSLKKNLNYEVGIISFVDPIEYDTGEEFIEKCENYKLEI